MPAITCTSLYVRGGGIIGGVGARFCNTIPNRYTGQGYRKMISPRRLKWETAVAAATVVA